MIFIKSHLKDNCFYILFPSGKLIERSFIDKPIKIYIKKQNYVQN